MREGGGYACLALASIASLPKEAQDAFAGIADFTRDCMDIADDVGQSEYLNWGDILDETIAKLETAGFCLCAAHRHVRVTNKSWRDQTPMHWHITYLLASPLAQPASKVAVSRKVELG